MATTLLISDREVRDLFRMEDAMTTMREYVNSVGRGTTTQIPRVQVNTQSGWLRIQPGLLESRGYMGFKAYTLAKRYGPRYAYFLYRVETGELVSIMEADSLTMIRTGAVAGIATNLLSNGGAETLGLVGSGRQARAAAEAITAATKIRSARVYSPTAEHRVKFARELAELGVDAEAVGDPASAVKGCEVVTTASNNRTMEPIVRGDWIPRGAHVNALGAVGRGRVEFDSSAFSRSTMVVVDSVEECLQSSEEVITAIQVGALKRDDLIELPLVAGGRRKRGSADDITLFKSQGSGAQDLFAAARVFELAQKHGAGRDIGEVTPPRPSS